MYLYPVVEIRVVILFQLVTIIMMVYLMEIRLIVIVSVLTHRGKKVGFHSVRTCLLIN